MTMATFPPQNRNCRDLSMDGYILLEFYGEARLESHNQVGKISKITRNSSALVFCQTLDRFPYIQFSCCYFGEALLERSKNVQESDYYDAFSTGEVSTVAQWYK